MTDIRCPNCDEAFFDPTHRTPPKENYHLHRCRACGDYILIPLADEIELPFDPSDPLAIRTWVILCFSPDPDSPLPHHLSFWGTTHSNMDGDSGWHYECETCGEQPNDWVYSARVDEKETATSPEYDTDNPWAEMPTLTEWAENGQRFVHPDQATLRLAPEIREDR